MHAREPGVISSAEESTAWPGVSRPTYLGGLGFGFKWNMGWMHDTLSYFTHEPVHRRFHHHELTFSLVYAWTENFILPLSHDEVVHGKGSLLSKMPGDRWQQLANLRAPAAPYVGHRQASCSSAAELATPGGAHGDELPWWLLDRSEHSGIRDLVREHRTARGAVENDFSHEGFRWLAQRRAEPTRSRSCNPAAESPLVCCEPRARATGGLPARRADRRRLERVVNTDSTFYGAREWAAWEPWPPKRSWHDQPYRSS